MSHVYGFAMIALLNYVIIGKVEFNGKWGVIGLLSALVVLLRPINAIYLMVLFFAYRKHLDRPNLDKSNIGFAIIAVLLFSLQMLYWYNAYGTLYPSGYQSESFSNLFSPNLILVLFSPNNGYLPYALVFGIVLLLSIVRWKVTEHKRLVLLSWVTFGTMIYVTAAWWTYDFGCGMGVRNMVDFSSLWMIMVALVLKTMEQNNRVFRGVIAFLLILCLFNMKLTYAYDNCFFGDSNWDWQFYFEKIWS